MADQQYCLRWNNHQSTLISVFDSLQERGCMVDCTLAAEGQSLQAHKVVLSACSPYLEDLLSKHYDKHPILLLKDVKFEELKAMMDYMYRGEVNVAQDKLNTFLRAAESLQIKGLSDGGTDPPDSGGTTSTKRTAKGTPVSVRSNQLTVRKTNLDDSSSRDGSTSPSQRKRRRRRGSETSDIETSNVSDGKQSTAAAAPVSGPSETSPIVPASAPSDDNILSSITESAETENATDSGFSSAVPQEINNVIRDRDNVLIEPKTEYLEEDGQDLNLEDEDGLFRAGPSHARGTYEGDGDDDVYMTNQDSGANAQVVNGGVNIKMEPMDSEEYRLCWEDSNSSAEPEPEPRPVPHRSVRDCFVRLENIVLPGLRAPRPERSPSPEAPRRDGGRGRSRARSRSVAPARPGSRAASRPRHKSRDPRSASCPRKPSSGMPRIMLGRSKSASAQALLKCALCLKSFHLLASLNKHVQAHQLSTPDRCLLCGAHVEGLGQAVEHFLSHPAEPLGPGREATVECRVCGRVFPRKRLYRLATHVLTHTGEQPFHCATCHGQFRTTSAVLLHAQRVHGARDAGFTKKAALVRSIAPQFRCALCAVRVTSARQLDKHQQEVHGGCKGPGVHSATCLYCPVVLDSPGDMERHLREAHAQDRPYACQRCPKRFPTKWGVDRHYRRTHSHKFSCSMCPARFSNSKACLDHVNQVHQKPTSV